MNGQASQARTDALMRLWLTTSSSDYARVDAEAEEASSIADLSEIERRQLNGFMSVGLVFSRIAFTNRKSVYSTMNKWGT